MAAEAETMADAAAGVKPAQVRAAAVSWRGGVRPRLVRVAGMRGVCAAV